MLCFCVITEKPPADVEKSYQITIKVRWAVAIVSPVKYCFSYMFNWDEMQRTLRFVHVNSWPLKPLHFALAEVQTRFYLKKEIKPAVNKHILPTRFHAARPWFMLSHRNSNSKQAWNKALCAVSKYIALHPNKSWAQKCFLGLCCNFHLKGKSTTSHVDVRSLSMVTVVKWSNKFLSLC